ncbi:hypothetical protein [Helicobacter zhangjianzhongii]|uniref:Uncharacterized protein n=1 Tax=Helicobacter zhangjianzhongii TaxID=2974574 RepID=A0ACC6FQQ6_9HELI|nr:MULTISPECIES: hypothetical protein [unclassified Helicobacter]MDL0079666.1 hypothetical protein [Helicobacter sp. CPD2-1]MDL0081437.1 hypothetical protein [Helicobacter sp. XJK30-2]
MLRHNTPNPLESTFSHNAPCLSLRADLSAWQSIQKTAKPPRIHF